MNQSDTKLVLITGANKGIGFEAARILVSTGAHVFVGARDSVAGKEAAGKLGGTASFIQLDVTDPNSIQRAMKEVSESAPRLDVLVNNAGILLDGEGDVFHLEAGTLRDTLETNLIGPLRVAQTFLPLLRRSASPRIINVSSGAGQLSEELGAWAPAYSISKTALNSLTHQLAAALPGFAVNSVCPGWCRTDMGGGQAPRSAAQGADTIAWLATEAPQSVTAKFLRDRKELKW